MPQHYIPSALSQRQRGVSLFIVLVFVMLTMLLTLWASRTSLFNEMVVGNDADWQRAFEAAQTLLQDAELDIRGERGNGEKCTTDNSHPTVCRQTGVLQFPLSIDGKDGVFALLRSLENSPTSTRCTDGLCLKPERTKRPDFWQDDDKSSVKEMLKVGVRYGTYTGAKVGSNDAPGNPLLSETDEGKGGWYWIEVMRHEGDSAQNRGLIADKAASSHWIVPINSTPPVIYRITALAKGRKEHTQVALQQVYVLNKLRD